MQYLNVKPIFLVVLWVAQIMASLSLNFTSPTMMTSLPSTFSPSLYTIILFIENYNFFDIYQKVIGAVFCIYYKKKSDKITMLMIQPRLDYIHLILDSTISSPNPQVLIRRLSSRVFRTDNANMCFSISTSLDILYIAQNREKSARSRNSISVLRNEKHSSNFKYFSLIYMP